ncbi:hypothetical protein FRC19_003996 [Serendipita sp. 401]|nr:hypothetical protein FRC19_003996 [Serendipita sp. 401]
MTAQDIVASLERLYEPNAVYENPLVTATSREMILDIHNLSRRIADVEIARPRALLAWLFGWRKPRRRPITTAGGADNVKSRSDEEQALDEEEEEPAWFEALKCWSEIGDIVAESEGWDGTRRTVIEHTLHILLLPSLHTPAATSSTSNIRSSWTSQAEFDPHSIPTTTSSSTSSSSFTPSSSSSIPSLLHGLTNPVLTIRGISLPTPFHLQLRIITKLTFNEQGRVSAHRDFWDVKDLVGGLIPGARAAQWVLTRLAARGFATASWLLLGDWTWGGGGRARSGRREQEEYEREELLRTAAAVERRQYEEEEGRRGSATSLRGWPRFEMGTQQAPDTDLDTFDS